MNSANFNGIVIIGSTWLPLPTCWAESRIVIASSSYGEYSISTWWWYPSMKSTLLVTSTSAISTSFLVYIAWPFYSSMMLRIFPILLSLEAHT